MSPEAVFCCIELAEAPPLQQYMVKAQTEQVTPLMLPVLLLSLWSPYWLTAEKRWEREAVTLVVLEQQTLDSWTQPEKNEKT